MSASQRSTEGAFIQAGRPLVIPGKNIAAVFTGDMDVRHTGGKPILAQARQIGNPAKSPPNWPGW
jgi:hypothetical protein